MRLYFVFDPRDLDLGRFDGEREVAVLADWAGPPLPRPPGVHHLSDFLPGPGARGAREEAQEIVARLSTATLASGRPLFRSFPVAGGQAWWFLEIALQEPAYLGLRFLRQVQRCLERLRPDEVAIWGRPQNFAWKEALLRQAAGLGPAGLVPRLGEGLVPPPGRLSARWAFRLPPCQGPLVPPGCLLSIPARVLSARAARIAAALEGWGCRLQPLLGAMARGVGRVGSLLLLPGLALELLAWRLAESLLGRRAGSGAVAPPRAPRRPSLLASALDRLGRGLAARGERAARVFARGPWCRTAYGALHRLGRKPWGPGSLKALAVLGRELLVLSAAGAKRRGVRELLVPEVARTVGRRRFLLFAEAENLRFAHAPEGPGWWIYNPYMEGVAETLAGEAGEEMALLVLGDPRALPPGLAVPRTWFFLDRCWLGGGRRAGWPAWNGVLADPALQAALRVDGVDLFPCLEPTLRAGEEILGAGAGAADFYELLLRAVRPEALLLYNWEGVFRPLMLAARRLGIAVAGIQQALGPYVHGLRHDRPGYRFGAGGDPDLFPAPERFFLWGEFHRAGLASYGYPESSLLATGYCRLGRHARLARTEEERAAAAARARAALGLPDDGAGVLVFSAQLRVLNISLTLDRNYLATLAELVRLAEEHGLRIVVKPWASDAHGALQRYLATFGGGRTWFFPPDLPLHNADLLCLSRWCVGTFSSFLGEAALCGNACVLLDYPEARYYFETSHVNALEGIFRRCPEPGRLREILGPLVADERRRRHQAARARAALAPVFGEGHEAAAARLVAAFRRWREEEGCPPGRPEA